MYILVYSYHLITRKLSTLKFKSLKMKLMITKYNTIKKNMIIFVEFKNYKNEQH